MSTPIQFLRKLLDSGVPLDAAMTAAEHFEQETLAVIEGRRAKDRDRKARKTRNSTESAETTESAEMVETPPHSLPPSPQTPQPPTHTPPDITTRVRGCDAVGFVQFWAAYPNKAGKDPARKAFDRAVKRCDVETLLAAIERQRTWEQWQRGFVPHAATWLNNGRWQDEPPPIPVMTLNAGRQNVPGPDAKQSAREDSLRSMHAGAMAALDRRRTVVG